MRITGNGEGLTVLLLTDAESRLIRKALAEAVTLEDDFGDPDEKKIMPSAVAAYTAGVERATERMKAEEKAGRKKA